MAKPSEKFIFLQENVKVVNIPKQVYPQTIFRESSELNGFMHSK
jgi:hypothetical protein